MWLASHPDGIGSALTCATNPKAATAIVAALRRKYFRNNSMQNLPWLPQLVGPIACRSFADIIARRCATVGRWVHMTNAALHPNPTVGDRTSRDLQRERWMPRMMRRLSNIIAICFLACITTRTAAADWPAGLPVYDHIVIVIEENKDFEQILDARPDAPYIRQLASEGASFSRMFGEEHHSQ